MIKKFKHCEKNIFNASFPNYQEILVQLLKLLLSYSEIAPKVEEYLLFVRLSLNSKA